MSFLENAGDAVDKPLTKSIISLICKSGKNFMSDELKGRGPIGELIARVFKMDEEEKPSEEEDFQERDPFIQT